MDSTGTVTVTAVDNDVDAPDKEVTVWATTTNAHSGSVQDSAPLTIEDDDNAAPTGAPTIDDTTPVVGETLTADASNVDDPNGLTNRSFTWQWIRVSGGTETEVAGATTASYTVADADVGATLKVRVGFTDDEGTEETVESAETAVVEALPRPVVAVAPVASPVAEGEDAQFRVTRTGVTAGALTVAYRVSETGAMVAPGEEGAKSVDFGDGDTEQTVTVPTVEDTVHVADSTVTVTLTPDAAYDLGTATAEVTVTDDDNAAPTGAPTIDDTTPVVGQTLTVDPSGIDDPDGLTGATYAWRWVRVASGGAETEVGTGSSYVVAAGDVGATLKVEASFTDDGGTAETVESAETAVVAVALPVLSIGDASVDEGDSGDRTTLYLTVTLSRAWSGPVTVRWSTADGTAAAGRDYTAGNGSLTFGAGETGKTVSVSVTGDEVDEPDETFTVRLSSPSGATIGDGTATGTIRDDDDAPAVTLVLTPDSIEENGGLSTVTARLDRPSSEATTVTVTVTPVLPAVADDYTLSLNLELTVAADETESTGAVTVTAVDNAVDAPDKVVMVSATAANPQGVTAPEDVTLTIVDDDEPVLSIDDASVDEGDSGSTTMQFTVMLDPSARGEVTVDWASADGTATAGTDYTAGNGSLTFSAGETSRTVTVSVTGDHMDEPDETLTVTLSSPSGATIEDGTGTGTIVDDDDPPTVTLVLTPDTIEENGGVSTVTAHLDHPSSEETTVTVSVTPVSPAVAGDCTLSANRVLTVAAGATTSTGLVAIAAVDNDVGALDKEVTVSATATNALGVTAPEAVTLTIRDDDLIDGRQRRLEYALASFGRTVVQDLVTAVEDRPVSGAAGTTATLAGTPVVSFRSEEGVYEAVQRHVGPDGDLLGTVTWRELLTRSHFQLSLGDEGEGEAGGSGAGALVLWGRGSQSWSAGRLDPAVATRGEVLSGQLGLEFGVREDGLLGVMLSGSAGALDFDGELETEVETELVGVHPYAQWSPRQGLRTWAMLGYGVGEATLTDRLSTLTETDIETDIEMVMAAAGGSNEVASRWGLDWSVGTNGFFVQLDADEQAELLPAVRSEVWQVRLLLEGRAGKDFGGVSGLSGNVELAARVDGGDAETGMGMELGGGVVYGRADLGLEVEASGRMLLSHEEEGLEDAGVSLALEVDPGESGRGLYFALTPSWGNAASGARSVWEGRETTAGESGGRDRFEPQMRLSSELGYATPLPTRRGALTSYGAFSSDGGAARQYRIGRRLELAGIASMSLEAERRESAGVAPEHGIWLRGSIRY